MMMISLIGVVPEVKQYLLDQVESMDDMIDISFKQILRDVPEAVKYINTYS